MKLYTKRAFARDLKVAFAKIPPDSSAIEQMEKSTLFESVMAIGRATLKAKEHLSSDEFWLVTNKYMSAPFAWWCVERVKGQLHDD